MTRYALRPSGHDPFVVHGSDSGGWWRPMSPRRVRTLLAHHEAGHAILALVFGQPIEKVTIVRGAEYAGAAFVQDLMGTTHTAALVRAAQMIAGPVAEAQTMRYPPHRIALMLANHGGGWCADVRNINNAFAAIEYPTSELPLNDIWRAVEEMMTRGRPLVRAVAAALALRGTLKEEDVMVIHRTIESDHPLLLTQMANRFREFPPLKEWVSENMPQAA